jgi:opacity protein-like surface antigen
MVLTPPSTGRSEKRQGAIFMALGGLTALAGAANMNADDPCDDVADSPYVECVSNADAVRTTGVVGVGVGIATLGFGVVRYFQGHRKAQDYEAWRRGQRQQVPTETRRYEARQSVGRSYTSRRGFLIGVGAGVGRTSYKPSDAHFGASIPADRARQRSLVTDVKLGYAPSERWAFYWMSKVSWFRVEGLEDDIVLTNGFGGLGMTYPLRTVARPLALNAGIGFSSWSAPFEGDVDSMYGLGLVLGTEYEFSPHWLLDADLMWGRPSQDGVSLHALGFKLTINYLWY